MAKLQIDRLSAPLFVSWQLTRDCDLACVHCCTDSAPGKRLADELDADAALRVAGSLASAGVPYVMLCGGEPLTVPHFHDVAAELGRAGVQLKIETNGQRFAAEVAGRLAALPIRSIQVSLDADTQTVYGRQRAGGVLSKSHSACRAIRAAGLPLEITFAPTRINIHETAAVIARAIELGAFRFNTGRLMRIGTASRHWEQLCPNAEQYAEFLRLLESWDRRRCDTALELCYKPFSMVDGLRASLAEPPATLLVMPNGQVKVAAALPFICADLRTDSPSQAWKAYCDAWGNPVVRDAMQRAIADESTHAGANLWRPMNGLKSSESMEVV